MVTTFGGIIAKVVEQDFGADFFQIDEYQMN